MTMDLYLKSSDTIFLTLFVIEMFISCTRVLMGLLSELSEVPVDLPLPECVCLFMFQLLQRASGNIAATLYVYVLYNVK
jgi:hypothetical protein